jgi:hypothetical protein
MLSASSWKKIDLRPEKSADFIYQSTLRSFPQSCENLKTRRSNEKKIDTEVTISLHGTQFVS